MRTVTVEVPAVPHKGPAWGLELQPQQGAQNKAVQGQSAGMTAQRRR